MALSCGTQLWTQLFTSLPSLAASQANQAQYDAFARNQIFNLANVLPPSQRGNFGIAQKMFNLLLKDHWALNRFPLHTELLLHLPLDDRVLCKLVTIPAPWCNSKTGRPAWTKVLVSAANGQQVWNSYQQIQASLRALWQHVSPRF